MLTEKQFESINAKIEKLLCKPVNLETGFGVDGDNYKLIVRSRNKLQAFKWQSIFRTNNSEEFKLLKEEVTNLVGDLMNFSQFPNGSKQIVVERSRKAIDSVKIDVFLTNQYNLRKSKVFFDDKVISQDRDGIAKFNIHRNDTFGINTRIKIQVELLNGEKVEM